MGEEGDERTGGGLMGSSSTEGRGSIAPEDAKLLALADLNANFSATELVKPIMRLFHGVRGGHQFRRVITERLAEHGSRFVPEKGASTPDSELVRASAILRDAIALIPREVLEERFAGDAAVVDAEGAASER